MAFCNTHGIPHSIFLGRVWPHAEDPHWLPEDRIKALEYQEWDAARCPGCGRHDHEWQDEQGRELRDLPFEAIKWYCPIDHVVADANADLPSEPEARRGWSVRLRRAGA